MNFSFLHQTFSRYLGNISQSDPNHVQMYQQPRWSRIEVYYVQVLRIMHPFYLHERTRHSTRRFRNSCSPRNEIVWHIRRHVSKFRNPQVPGTCNPNDNRPGCRAGQQNCARFRFIRVVPCQFPQCVAQWRGTVGKVGVLDKSLFLGKLLYLTHIFAHFAKTHYVSQYKHVYVFYTTQVEN